MDIAGKLPPSQLRGPKPSVPKPSFMVPPPPRGPKRDLRSTGKRKAAEYGPDHPVHRVRICKARKVEQIPRLPGLTRILSFGELEPLAGALLAVLLSLVRARVASEEAQLLEPASQFGVELHQSPGNAQ